MYKLTIGQLEAFKAALIKSNELLKRISEEESTDEFDSVIDENEKQIDILTTKFYIK